MKYMHLLLLALVCIVSSVSGKSLKECSLVLWPKFDWIGSKVESIASEKLVSGDFIVYPGALGMKGWFRSEEYQIDKQRVMVQLEQATVSSGFYYYLEKHQDGIGGVFVTEFDGEAQFSENKSNRRRFHEYLNSNDQTLAYCVNKASVDRPANLDFLGKQCDQLIIYYDRALLLDPEKTVAFFKKAISRARVDNENVKVLAGIELKLDVKNVEEVLALFEEISDEIDGVLIVFEGSADQNSTAVRLINHFRS